MQNGSSLLCLLQFDLVALPVARGRSPQPELCCLPPSSHPEGGKGKGPGTGLLRKGPKNNLVGPSGIQPTQARSPFNVVGGSAPNWVASQGS